LNTSDTYHVERLKKHGKMIFRRTLPVYDSVIIGSLPHKIGIVEGRNFSSSRLSRYELWHHWMEGWITFITGLYMTTR
jgi:hypothetical protein